MIKADGIEKVYGTGRNALRVLKGVSLSIGEGEIVSIMGPSGAGKSTLLNVMGCLDGFQSGSLSVLGRELSGLSVEDLSMFRNRHIGFVFQLHNLLPDFTALENVMMPMLIRRDRRQAARAAAISVIERFGMEDRLDHRPGELSGGECQRIAVARAIVGRPDIILADEPTGSLDSENSRVLMNTLFELGRENGATIVVVTHDAGIASITGRTITIVDGSITETQ
ncbi:MAG TPA: ABC transporter ATP-binding protein [Spirochaetota bacterium]|nr:ABC transporter ATP-binding protein [Spirochaetota bacterium]HNU92745.1 ABC transporter ATP-binding protein [Spirochaetota bacterium]HPV99033.1 ABC transporter ATP-binding protein [Spirochaetota bacterium]